MKVVRYERVVQEVARLCQESNCFLNDDVLSALREAKEREISPVGVEVLEQLLANADIAKSEAVPICQDTGIAVVFLELGQEVRIEGGFLYDAINEGVRLGYKNGYLRKSVVNDPLRRQNTGDNTPAVIHTCLVPGESLKITVVPKGGGSENMSVLAMLTPAAGLQGIKDFVVNAVKEAGANPCPPVVVGVGIGGSFEKVALLAKQALLRPLGERNPDPELAELEDELLVEINKLGIGPQGLGGRVTALAVHVEVYPCHIASLPVAVNLNCHAARHKSVTL